MKTEVLVNFPYTWMTVVAFILFLAVFVGMLIWVFRKDGKRFYDKCGNIPFNNGGGQS